MLNRKNLSEEKSKKILSVDFSQTYRTAMSLLLQGYHPIPVVPGGKRPLGGNWSQFCRKAPTEGQIEEWGKTYPQSNWGIACGNVVAIDIDEEDPHLNRVLRKRVEDALGPTPAIRIGRKPRCVMLYRAVGRIRTRRLGKLEVRGHGSQVVAYGRHPSGPSYRWAEDLYNIPLDSLPPITPEKVDQFVGGFRKSEEPSWSGREGLIEHLPEWLQRDIKTKKPKGERSDHQFSVIAALFERGGTRPEVYGIVKAYPDGFAEKLDTPERALKEIARIEAKVRPKATALTAVDLHTFLKREIPPRQMIMSPWLPEQGLTLIYAMQGVGKTLLALHVGMSIAAGKDFLKWKVPSPRRVLYLDGEMSAAVMQERLHAISKGMGVDVGARFRLITPDLQNNDMPNLATWIGQDAIENFVSESDVVIIDNLATLCRTADENRSDAWVEMVQGWLLRQRRAGKSIVLIHHANKEGGQRGTSARTDILDTTMKLERIKGYSPDEGAKFRVSWEKSRGFYGRDARSFVLQYEAKGGVATWTADDDEDEVMLKVAELTKEGMSQRKIAVELNLHSSKVQRLKQKAHRLGYLKEEG